MIEEYIKMCIVAEEIQQMWKPQKDDWWVYPKEDLSGELLDKDIDKIRKGTIWIPRLDQLQEMKMPPSARLWLVNFIQNPPPLVVRAEGSVEEMWLLHIMWVNYHKWWSGKEWIYVDPTTIHDDDIVE